MKAGPKPSSAIAIQTPMAPRAIAKTPIPETSCLFMPSSSIAGVKAQASPGSEQVSPPPSGLGAPTIASLDAGVPNDHGATARQATVQGPPNRTRDPQVDPS